MHYGFPCLISNKMCLVQVKFHIKSHLKLLHRESVTISSIHYLNLEQLKKSLKTLYDLYDVNRRSGFVSKHEAEFYSFHVLLHLGSNCSTMVKLPFQYPFSGLVTEGHVQFRTAYVLGWSYHPFFKFIFFIWSFFQDLQCKSYLPISKFRNQQKTISFHTGLKFIA